MKTFTVKVCRIAPQIKELIVPAKNMREAKKIALDIAPNKDFTGLEKDSEYKIVDAWEGNNG